MRWDGASEGKSEERRRGVGKRRVESRLEDNGERSEESRE